MLPFRPARHLRGLSLLVVRHPGETGIKGAIMSIVLLCLFIPAGVFACGYALGYALGRTDGECEVAEYYIGRRAGR